MAILKAQGGGEYRSYKLETLAPKGTFAATCVDCMEHTGVERKKYQSEEVEVLDTTRYLFIIKSEEGPFLVQSNEMKTSAYKESALAKFISSWTGELPAPGFDTLDMVGEPCQVTVVHKTSARGTVYPSISIAPLLDKSLAPDANALEIPGGSRSNVEVKTTVTAGATADAGDTEATEESPF